MLAQFLARGLSRAKLLLRYCKCGRARESDDESMESAARADRRGRAPNVPVPPPWRRRLRADARARVSANKLDDVLKPRAGPDRRLSTVECRIDESLTCRRAHDHRQRPSPTSGVEMVDKPSSSTMEKSAMPSGDVFDLFNTQQKRR